MVIRSHLCPVLIKYTIRRLERSPIVHVSESDDSRTSLLICACYFLYLEWNQLELDVGEKKRNKMTKAQKSNTIRQYSGVKKSYLYRTIKTVDNIGILIYPRSFGWDTKFTIN